MILLMVKMSNFVLNQNAWLFQNEKVENSKTKKINGYLKRKKSFGMFGKGSWKRNVICVLTAGKDWINLFIRFFKISLKMNSALMHIQNLVLSLLKQSVLRLIVCS